MSETRGFVKVGEVVAYAAEALDESAGAFTPLDPSEADEAVAICRRWHSNGFLNLGWKLLLPEAQAIRRAMGEGHLFFWWRGRRGFISAWDDDEGEELRFTVGMDACAGEDRASLLMDLRRLAFARRAAASRWMNALDEPALGALEAAGYKKDWEDSGFLYERKQP